MLFFNDKRVGDDGETKGAKKHNDTGRMHSREEWRNFLQGAYDD